MFNSKYFSMNALRISTINQLNVKSQVILLQERHIGLIHKIYYVNISNLPLVEVVVRIFLQNFYISLCICICMCIYNLSLKEKIRQKTIQKENIPNLFPNIANHLKSPQELLHVHVSVPQTPLNPLWLCYRESR